MGSIRATWTLPGTRRYPTRNDKSKTLAMREGDVGLKLVVVAGKGSGIKTTKDLAGRKLLIDTSGCQEALLPEHCLKAEGVDMGKVAKVTAKSRKTLLAELAAGNRPADVKCVPMSDGHFIPP